MDSLKQTVLDAISKMPDSVNVDEIMYKLYVIDKVMKGDKDIKEGKLTGINKLRKEIEQW